MKAQFTTIFNLVDVADRATLKSVSGLFQSWKTKLNVIKAERRDFRLALYSIPDFQQRFVNMDTLPINQELQVWDLWAVELLLQRLCNSQVVIAIW